MDDAINVKREAPKHLQCRQSKTFEAPLAGKYFTNMVSLLVCSEGASF